MLCARLYVEGNCSDPEGNRVGFFGFPKDQNLQQEWLVKIWRDVGPHFKLRGHKGMLFASTLHFHPSDVKEEIGGKKGFM